MSDLSKFVWEPNEFTTESKALESDFDVTLALLDQIDLEEQLEAKYSPDQPRDDDGRFGSGGGGGSSDDATPTVNPGDGGPHPTDRQEILHEAADTIPGVNADGKTVDFNARKAYLDTVVQKVQSEYNTKTLYDSLGDKQSLYTPEREAIHGQILDDVYKQYANVPTDKIAIMTGGTPGSGKSTGLDAAFSNGWLPGNKDDYVVINPDDMKEQLASRGLTPDDSNDPRLAGMSPMEKAGLIHEESSDLANQLAARALGDNKNVIYDITMASTGSVDKRLGLLDNSGYQKNMIYTDVPISVSMSRAEGRYERGQAAYEAGQNNVGGRFVSSDISGVKSDPTWGTANRAVYEGVKSRADNWVTINTDVPMGQAPKLIEKSS